MISIGKVRAHFDSPIDLLWFAEIVVLITVLPVIVRGLSLSSVLKLLTPRKRKIAHNPPSQDKIAHYTDWILRRRIGPYRPNCLKRSLVLYHFLRKSGLDVEFCLGVHHSQELGTRKHLRGHAWLSQNGRIILEPCTNRPELFTETYRFPGELSDSSANHAKSLLEH